jgi:hypothetical protein
MLNEHFVEDAGHDNLIQALIPATLNRYIDKIMEVIEALGALHSAQFISLKTGDIGKYLPGDRKPL